MPESRLIEPITDEISSIDNIAGEIAAYLICDWQDYGIGSYEFWGAHGVHIDWQPIIQRCRVYADITKLWKEYDPEECSDEIDTTLEQWADAYLDKVSGTIDTSGDNEAEFSACPCGKPFKYGETLLMEYEIEPQ